MSLDRNEFFRQAVRRICGSLDIQRAMANCFHYIRAFLPMNEITFYLLDRDLIVVRVPRCRGMVARCHDRLHDLTTACRG